MSSKMRTLFTGNKMLALISTSAYLRADLKENMEYLLAHEGGSVTLFPDAYGARANEYFSVWNKMNADGVFKGQGRCAVLKRTPTGLELEMK